MSNDNQLLQFLTESQSIFLVIGAMSIVLGIGLVVMSLLDTKRALESGRAQQISATPGALLMAVGVIMILAQPVMSYVSSFLSK